MRERVTVVILSVTLSVCVSLFDFGEGAIFRVETYINKCFKFENRSYFGEKASGTSAVTAVIYSGNAQSLNGLARDLPFALYLWSQGCRLLSFLGNSK